MDEYVAKPVHAQQLFAAIEDARKTSRHPTDDSREVTDQTETGLRRVPGLDWSAALQYAAGDRDALAAVVQAAMNECPGRLTDICEAVERGDVDAVRQAAHALKGSIRCFGETPTFGLATEIEQLAEANRLDDVSARVAQLEVEMCAICDAMAEYIETSAGS